MRRLPMQLPCAPRLRRSKDQIARDLARGTAISVVNERCESSHGTDEHLQSQFAQLSRSTGGKGQDCRGSSASDLKELAKAQGFEYGTTGMVDTDTAGLSPIGFSFVYAQP